MIDRKRVTWLANILEANGLITRKKKNVHMRNYVLYYPTFGARISDDGYIVSENGEKIAPSSREIYLAKGR